MVTRKQRNVLSNRLKEPKHRQHVTSATLTHFSVRISRPSYHINSLISNINKAIFRQSSRKLCCSERIRDHTAGQLVNCLNSLARLKGLRYRSLEIHFNKLDPATWLHTSGQVGEYQWDFFGFEQWDNESLVDEIESIAPISREVFD